MKKNKNCALCGVKLKHKYVLRIASYSAYNGLEINLLDLSRDVKKEIEEIVKESSKKSAKKLLEDVCTMDEFSICRRCRDGFIKEVRSRFRNRRKH